MAQIAVLCPTTQRGTRTVLLSPSVGLVKLLVSDGQPLGPGQIIFELWRLNTCFMAALPDGISGIVVRKQLNAHFFVAFHEDVIEIEPESRSLKPQNVPEALASKQGVPIYSPMDGMFYLSPSPSDPPFVKVGDQIVPGQTIGLIEVMKCFYPLKYQGASPTIVIAIHLMNAAAVMTGTKIFEVAS